MPSTARLAVVAMLAASLSACTAGRAVVVGGGALALGGVAVAATDGDELEQTVNYAFGGAMIVLGAIGVIAGSADETNRVSTERQHVAIKLALETSTSAARGDCVAARASAKALAAFDSRILLNLVTYNAAVASCVTLTTASAPQTESRLSSEEAAPVEPAPRVFLPGHARSVQASVAARAGKCAAARTHVEALRETDAALADRLVERDGAVRACVTSTATR